MGNICIGYILIFLDFNLNLGNCTIGLLPDFIGYICMINGLRELESESSNFQKAQPYAMGMSIYTGILYAVNLFGISANLGWLSEILAIVSMAITYYILYTIIIGVQDIERTRNVGLNSAKLKATWMPMVFLRVVTYITLLISLPTIAVICMIAWFILSITFLIALNKAKNLYKALPLISDYTSSS